MEAHVVIATKGRPEALPQLLESLGRQTKLPSSITFVGSCAQDVESVERHALAARCPIELLIAPSAGLCIQRNCAVDHLVKAQTVRSVTRQFFVVFFDDDYRPAHDWLEQAAQLFESQSEVVGLTGRVLADGVHGYPLDEQAAEDYLSGRRLPERHWATGSQSRTLTSLYGCNMAFRDTVILRCRFDENLPLYGWQEDRDYTAQAKQFGNTLYTPTCQGVHLGSKSGRVSGLRFGYSQVANPLYMWEKGTMSARNGLRFVARHLLSNSVRTLQANQQNDYPGRLRGNALALLDLARGTCHPTRVLQIR
jgi:hypothetical protein